MKYKNVLMNLTAAGQDPHNEFEIQKIKTKQMEHEITLDRFPLEKTDPMDYDDYQKVLFHSVCRGDVHPHPKDLASLKCKYLADKSAFLKIAPLKLEEISVDPYIVVFHNALYGKEIELIKHLSIPKVPKY